MVAAFYVFAAILGNAMASDSGDLMSDSELILWRLGALAFVLPLLLPWRVFAGRVRWRVLVGWLCLDGLVLTSYNIYDLVWFFDQRPFDIWVTYALPTLLFEIAGVWLAVVAAVIARDRLDHGSSQVRSAV